MNTRLHSSRMRTARALTISPRKLCGGGGVYLVPGGICSGGCTWSWGVYLVQGGVCSKGGLPPGGVPGPGVSAPGVYLVQERCLLWGVYLVWGVSAPRGVYLVQGGVCSLGGVPGPGGCLLLGGCTWSGTPPTVDRHTPVNILPCPKLCLRAVKMLTDLRGYLYA